jgi:hypothetical protein
MVAREECEREGERVCLPDIICGGYGFGVAEGRRQLAVVRWRANVLQPGLALGRSRAADQLIGCPC